MSGYSRHRESVRRAKSILCLLLMMSLQWMPAGCGSLSPVEPLRNSRIVVPIDSGSMLGQALAGTSVAAARVFDLDLNAMTFALKDRGGHSLIAGRLANSDGGVIISSLTLRNSEHSAELEVDAARRISAIYSDGGTTWMRNTEGTAIASARQSLSLIDANRDLLSLANDIDTGKLSDAAQSQLDPVLAALLSLISALLVPAGGVLQPLLVMFSIMTAVEAMQATSPRIQTGVSGAYVIEHYLDPERRRREVLTEFDTERTMIVLGEPGALPDHVLLRSNGAVIHVVTDGQGGVAGVRSGATMIVLDGNSEQLTAYYSTGDEPRIRTTTYLGYEIVDVLKSLSAAPRVGRSASADCPPPDGSAEVAAGFPLPAGSVFQGIAADAGLGNDGSICTQLAIYSAVLYALDRDGFIAAPDPAQRSLVGWGNVAEESGVCGSLYGPAQTCAQMMRSDEELLSESRDDDGVLNTTYSAANELLESLDNSVPERLHDRLETIASMSMQALSVLANSA